jgi:hypothetical protein
MRPHAFRLCSAVLTAVGLLTCAPQASAEVISLTLDDSGAPVTYNPNGGSSTTLNAGPFHWTQTVPLNTNFPTGVTTYCIDVDHFISEGNTYQYTAQSDLKLAPTIGNDLAKVSAINELFDRNYNSSLTSSANSAAFQLALWELVYDGASSKSLSAGRIQANNTQAQNMLDSLGTSYSNHDMAGHHLTALVSVKGAQDQITVTPNGVPAPPALLLAGVGVLALLGRARWNWTRTA